MTPNERCTAALRSLKLVDLTSLNDDDSVTSIQTLAALAQTPFGPPAALCIYPRFVPTAKAALAALGLHQVRLATVTNFPRGEASPAQAAAETAAAITLGADEVDVVFPWRALLAGQPEAGFELVSQCRALVGTGVLKVIIESGELKTPALIRQASEISIAAGAHFIKTSTGKTAVSATPEAAEIMIQAIRDSGQAVGFKAAGGVRSVAEAAQYLAIADRLMGPEWAQASTFRFGASSLLGSLLQSLAQGPAEKAAA